MTVPLLVIRSITFEETVIAIEYVQKSDFKANGLQAQHILLVPRGEDYEDEIDALNDAAIELLVDAMDDLERVEDYDFDRFPNDDDEDEDED